MKKLLILVLVVIVLFLTCVFLRAGIIRSPKSAEKIINNENTAQTSSNSIWIGTTYPPLPQGVITNAGSTIGYATEATHSLSDVTTPNGRELWLERLLSRDSSGKPTFKVTDSLPFTYSTTGATLAWNLCGVNDSNSKISKNDSIVALVNAYDLSYKGRATAVKAWKANEVTEKFEMISPNGIVCITEEGED